MSTNDTPHTYWSLFHKGVDSGGTLWGMRHFLFKNILVPFLIIVEIASSSLSVYMMGKVSGLASMSKVSGAFVLLTAIFSSYFVTVIKYLLRNKQKVIRQNVIEKIFKYIDHTIENPVANNFKIRLANNVSKRHRAIMGPVWTYANVVDTVVSLSTQIFRTITVVAFIGREHVWIVGVVCVGYFVVYKWIIPIVTKDETYPDMQKKREQAYSAYALHDNDTINPSHPYKSDSYIAKIVDLPLSWNEFDNRQTVSQTIISVSQDVIVYSIVLFFFLVNDYSNMLLLMLNRKSLFGMVDVWISLIKREQNAKKNMKELLSILDSCATGTIEEDVAISEEITAETDELSDDVVITMPLLTSTNNYEPGETEGSFSKKIVSITVTDFKYDFIKPFNDGQYKGKRDSYIEILNDVTFNFNRGVNYIRGKKGCGKSILLSLLAGQYEGKICKNMFATYNTGERKLLENEFADLVHERNYIHQKVAENMTFNGGIKMILSDLYPGMSLEAIREFCEIFGIQNKVPGSVNEMFPDKLSGGEIQAVAVSSCIAKALQSNPQFLVVDEIDKAMDDESAISVVKWLTDHFNGPIFMVSHKKTVGQYLANNNLLLNVIGFTGEFETEVCFQDASVLF